MSLNRTHLFSSHISSKKLNKTLNLKFERGFSPVLEPVYDGTRVVLKLTGWIGGEGEIPFDPSVRPYYLGHSDFVTKAEDAVDIAKGYISSVYLQDLVNAKTIGLRLDDNGELILQYDNFPNFIENKPAITTEVSQFIFSNNLDLSPKSNIFGATQYAIWYALEHARSKYNVPIITLDSNKISEVESMQGLTPDNPYFAMVGTDGRTTGVVGNCTITGYEGMCEPAELSGDTCTIEIPWREARWVISINIAGNPGEVLEVVIDGRTIARYTVQIGDDVNAIANGLYNYVLNHGGVHDFQAISITNNTFIVDAPPTTGTAASTWSESFYSSGITSGSISQVFYGVDYKPRTCKGVTGHFIGYDGTRWYDFGVSFSNTVIVDYKNNGIKYHIESDDNITVADKYQYIIYNHFIVDGIFTLDGTSQLIIFN